MMGRRTDGGSGPHPGLLCHSCAEHGFVQAVLLLVDRHSGWMGDQPGKWLTGWMSGWLDERMMSRWVAGWQKPGCIVGWHVRCGTDILTG